MKNINRKLFTITTVFMLAVVIACSDDLLDQSNNNSVSGASFGTNIEQVKKTVNAAYHPLNTPFLYGRVIHAAGFLRSDEYYVKEFGEVTRPAGLEGTPGARWATEIWQQLYQTIGRCNTIIGRTNEKIIPNETTRNELLGQAHFLRAFCYWHLILYFENVPLTLEEPDIDNLLLDQVTPTEIWPVVIDDFEKAEMMLPATWEGNEKGRATSGAATSFLGKSYLFRKEWEKAHIAFKKVIDTQIYDLLPAENFEDNFTETNENNIESVFELQYEAVATFLWGQNIPGTGTQGHFVIEYAPNKVTPDEGLYAHPWIKNLYETNNDVIRRNASIVYDYPGATGYGNKPFLEDFEEDLKVANKDKVEGVFVKKYARFNLNREDASADNLGAANGTNWRVVRYADVLLMMAEALNEDNKTSEAEPYLNQVRERAQLTPVSGLDKEAMKTAIIEERAMELYSEGHRFLDLVRWDLAEKYLGPVSAHPGPHPKFLTSGDGFFKKNQDEILWIPLSEISSNGKLKQNDGY